MPNHTVNTATGAHPLYPSQWESFDHPAAARPENIQTASGRPSSEQAKAQRTAIKQIARQIDKQINQFESCPNRSFLHGNQLEELKQSMTEAQLRLQAFGIEALSNEPPPPSLLRTSRANAALVAGAVSRTGAAAVSGTLAASFVSVGATAAVVVSAPAIPMVGCGFGVLHGCLDDIHFKPKAGRFVKSFGRGSLYAVLGTYSAFWKAVTKRGSINKKIFRMLDGMPSAAAYAERSRSSTRDIALSTDQKITFTLARIDAKRRDYPIYVPRAQRPNPVPYYGVAGGGDGAGCGGGCGGGGCGGGCGG